LTAGGVRIRPARGADVAAIAGIVERAYGGYVERIGMLPGPMRADHAERVSLGGLSVAEDGDAVVGLIDLVEAPDHMQVENVAVEPSRQGEGVGRALLRFAEDSARAAGLEEMRLYTHSKMTENRELYRRLGYSETDRRDEEGFDRVFLVKRLAAS
jgi:ribosomal protein S18 acetylase RimI-like enzyme